MKEQPGKEKLTRDEAHRLVEAEHWARGHWVKPDPKVVPRDGVYQVRGYVDYCDGDDPDRLCRLDRLFVEDEQAAWHNDPRGSGWIGFLTDPEGGGMGEWEYWSERDPEVER